MGGERIGDQDRGPAARAFQTRAGGSRRFGAQALETASPHPCPDESGRRVPGGLAARAPVRPFPLPPLATPAVPAAPGPRSPAARRCPRPPVLQVGAAPRPERAGLPREPGFRDSAPAALLPPTRDLELGPDLGSGTGGGASAVRPRGTSLPAAPRGPPARAVPPSSRGVDAGNFGALLSGRVASGSAEPRRLQAEVPTAPPRRPPLRSAAGSRAAGRQGWRAMGRAASEA